MKFSTSLLESDQKITSLILKSILSDTEKYFSNISKTLENNLKTIVKNGIINSPEYQSIASGKLQYHFGLPDSTARLQQILSIWERIKLVINKPKIKSSGIIGNIQLYMIAADYSDVLNLPASTFTTEKGEDLAWLQWLLLSGDKTIIKEYDIVIGPNPRSRTGNAVMKKTVNGKWSVPPEFAGTQNNNWITRVLDSISNDIDNTISRAINK